jgi:hypothetical protein
MNTEQLNLGCFMPDANPVVSSDEELEEVLVMHLVQRLAGHIDRELDWVQYYDDELDSYPTSLGRMETQIVDSLADEVLCRLRRRIKALHEVNCSLHVFVNNALTFTSELSSWELNDLRRVIEGNDPAGARIGAISAHKVSRLLSEEPAASRLDPRMGELECRLASVMRQSCS